MSCGCQNTSLPTGPGGANGYNAFTVTTAQFTVPSISSNVNIPVSNQNQYTGLWAIAGQIIFIEGAGYYLVVSSTNVLIVATNIGYTGNAVATTVIATGAKVSPAGLIGITGTNGVDGTSIITTSYVNSPNINQVGSYAQFLVASLNAGTIDDNGDSLVIYARLFYQQNSAGNNNGQFKIRLVENANVVELLLTPTSLFGGADYLELVKGFDYAEVKITATRASATTLNFTYKYKMGLAADFANAEGVFPTNTSFGASSQFSAVSTITWANQVDVLVLGQVDNVADYVKLGFFEIDLKRQI